MAIFKLRNPFYEQFRDLLEMNRVQDEVNRLYENCSSKGRNHQAEAHRGESRIGRGYGKNCDDFDFHMILTEMD